MEKFWIDGQGRLYIDILELSINCVMVISDGCGGKIFE